MVLKFTKGSRQLTSQCLLRDSRLTSQGQLPTNVFVGVSQQLCCGHDRGLGTASAVYIHDGILSVIKNEVSHLQENWYNGGQSYGANCQSQKDSIECFLSFEGLRYHRYKNLLSIDDIKIELKQSAIKGLMGRGKGVNHDKLEQICSKYTIYLHENGLR